MSTSSFQTRAGDGSWAKVFRSRRRAMHPTLGREMDVYLSTEVPIVIDLGGKPKAVSKEMEEIKARVADTLEAFKPEF